MLELYERADNGSKVCGNWGRTSAYYTHIDLVALPFYCGWVEGVIWGGHGS